MRLRTLIACALLLRVGLAVPPGARAQGIPERAERIGPEVGLYGGGVVGHDVPDFQAAGAQIVDLRLAWPLGSRARLGFRVESTLALWRTRAEGRRAWWMPSASLLLQVRLWRGLELDLTAGVGAPYHLPLQGDGAHVLVNVGLGALYYFYRHRRVHLALRVGFEAMAIPTEPGVPWLLVPCAGLLLRFPVYAEPPSLHHDDVPDPFLEDKRKFRRRRL